MCVYPVDTARLQGYGYERFKQNDIPIQEAQRLYSDWVISLRKIIVIYFMAQCFC